MNGMSGFNRVAFQGILTARRLTSLSLREGESEGVETSGWIDPITQAWTAELNLWNSMADKRIAGPEPPAVCTAPEKTRWTGN